MPWRSSASDRPPMIQRVDVEVLSVQVDAFVGEHFVDAVGDPLQRVGAAEVQNSAFFAAENPLRLILGQPGSRHDAFRLEPEQGFDSF